MADRWPLALVIAAGLGAACPARGDISPEALAHEDAGTAAYKRGEFRHAVEEYRKSYALTQAPVMLFNLAQAYRKLGESGEAIAFYRRYLAAAPASAKFRGLAEKWLRELEGRDAGGLQATLPPAPAPAERAEEGGAPKQPAAVPREPARKALKRMANRGRRGTVVTKQVSTASAPAATISAPPVASHADAVCSDPQVVRFYERCLGVKKGGPEDHSMAAGASAAPGLQKQSMERPAPKSQPERWDEHWSPLRLSLAVATATLGLAMMGVGIWQMAEASDLSQRARAVFSQGPEEVRFRDLFLDEMERQQRRGIIAFSIGGAAMLASTLISIVPQFTASKRIKNATVWLGPTWNGAMMRVTF